MTDNEVHKDEPTVEHQPVQPGLTVLALHEIQKVPELLARAKESIECGVSSFRAAAEYLAAAQELGVSQRQLADGVGKSAAWVNALLKWRERGYPDGTPFRPQAKARPQPVKSVQKTEQNGWTASGSLLDIAMVEADTSAEADVVGLDDSATVDAAEGNATKHFSGDQRARLIESLEFLGTERPRLRAQFALNIERRRAALGLTWDQLLIPAEEAEA
jgi:hypothetical protein